jgi:hypothetical protein
MGDSLRRNRDVVGFTLVYSVAWTTYGVVAGRGIAIPYFALILFVIAILTAIDGQREIDRSLLWAFSGWGLIHYPGGLLEVRGDVLYEYWILPFLRYDHVSHLVGYFVIGLAVADVARRWLPEDAPWVVFSLVFFMSQGIGALNEVVEFWIAQWFPSTHIGDELNLGLDLLANAVGAGMAGWLTVSRLAHIDRSAPSVAPDLSGPQAGR